MDTLASFQKLMERRKPISAIKLNQLMSNRRLGMAEQYDWNGRIGTLKRTHNTNFLCQANTILLFFTNERVAIAAPRMIVEGDDPMFPKTVLQKSVQIKYRCDITNDIEQGALLVTIALPLDAFHIQNEDGQTESMLDFIKVHRSF
jgi:hypothetical protein